jgi:hypothetical protein
MLRGGLREEMQNAPEAAAALDRQAYVPEELFFLHHPRWSSWATINVARGRPPAPEIEYRHERIASSFSP